MNILRLNSFRGLYIIPNKLLRRNPYDNIKERRYVVKAATVPIGFFDFYSDYREYVFLPILLSFIASQLLSQFLIERKNILALGLYSIFNAGWLDMMFLNSLFRDVIISSMIVYIIYLKIFIKIGAKNIVKLDSRTIYN